MPLPWMMSDRMSASPLPAYTVAGSLGATASAPIEATGIASITGIQVRPAFVVFHTPPPTAPV